MTNDNDPGIGVPARRFAFVQSTWHESIVEQCRLAFVREIGALGIDEDQIDVYRVPGALEIPLLAQRAARTRQYDAIIAAGLIVDGGIYRHEFVAASVLDALMRTQLDTDVPIISAVLTPQQFHEHQDHADFFHAHLAQKGTEAARACIGALAALDELAVATTQAG
jgi:6,7-dimethyl-8-ribityllumazine synthase